MQYLGTSLLTDDVPRLAEFYSRVLQTEPRGDHIHTEFAIPGGSLVLYSRSAAHDDMGFDTSGGDGYGNTVLTFTVDDVDREYRRIREEGIKVSNPPRTWPWGARSFQFRDPDGTMVNFVTPPTAGA